MIKISIILKDSKISQKTADCLKVQTVKDFEILTQSVNDTLISITKNITVVEESDTTAFYNSCLKYTKGKYIIFIDNNDTFDKAYFRILFLRAEQENSDICRGTTYCTLRKTNVSENVYTSIQPLFGTLFRKDLIKKHNITFDFNLLDFTFVCTYFANKISVSASAIYNHNTLTNIETLYKVRIEKYEKLWMFFWFVNNFMFVRDTSKNIYLKYIDSIIENLLVKGFENSVNKQQIKKLIDSNLDILKKSLLYTTDKINNNLHKLVSLND